MGCAKYIEQRAGVHRFLDGDLVSQSTLLPRILCVLSAVGNGLADLLNEPLA
jgi:hypothetical protein